MVFIKIKTDFIVLNCNLNFKFMDSQIIIIDYNLNFILMEITKFNTMVKIPCFIIVSDNLIVIKIRTIITN